MRCRVPRSQKQNEALDAVAAEVGCPAAGDDQIKCLRSVDMSEFLTANFNSTYNTWFAPTIDNITRHSDYPARLAAGQYASHVPLLTGTSNGEGTIFSIVYGAENSNFSSWINTFDADVAHIPDSDLVEAYPHSNTTSEALRSGTQYGDARFNCPVDYLIDLRSAKQDTWAYRFFGAYDNVVGPPNTAPTHGTEVPFFHGGNECFAGLANVTPEQQALADSIHGWLVDWIKDPSNGPGWEKTSPSSPALVKLGVPGDELSRIPASFDEFNKVCRDVYNPVSRIIRLFSQLHRSLSSCRDGSVACRKPSTCSHKAMSLVNRDGRRVVKWTRESLVGVAAQMPSYKALGGPWLGISGGTGYLVSRIVSRRSSAFQHLTHLPC